MSAEAEPRNRDIASKYSLLRAWGNCSSYCLLVQLGLVWAVMRVSARRKRVGRGLGSGVFLLLLGLSACERSDSGAPEAQPTKEQPVVPAEAKPEPPPFPIGEWKAEGALKSVKAELSAPVGKQAEEVAAGTDEGKKKDGEGPAAEISFEVQAGGEVSGKATVAGEQVLVRGRHEGESLRLDFTGARVKGSLVAVQEGEEFVGPLRASAWHETAEPKYQVWEADMRLQAVKKQP